VSETQPWVGPDRYREGGGGGGGPAGGGGGGGGVAAGGGGALEGAFAVVVQR
jgi:hypothetical protein